MIVEIKKDDVLINELTNTFKEILGDVSVDLQANPFSHYIAYLIDNKIVGYLNYYLIYERIEIANFNVLSSYQNRGIGTKLLEYIINLGKENITLEVKSNNEKALYLYEKMGFKKVGIRKGYYQGIDGILMERSEK